MQEDFMGGYDHGRRAGVAHVANHHVVCCAKLWEWGTGTYGRTWDKILTDEDGPYAELMVGAFSDNQPDFSWIKPYEVKTFKQYWYPVREIGDFKKANLHGAINLEMAAKGRAEFGVHTTSRIAGSRVVATCRRKIVFDEKIDIGPDRPFTHEITVPDETQVTDLRVALVSSEGEELVAYQPVAREPVAELPAPVKPPLKPEEIPTNEELYLTGLRIEQIHNPTVDPVDYYLEAVKRDAGDSRANTLLGIHYNKSGQYEFAEEHLRRAIARLSRGYTRLRNTEAHYQLGVSLRAQGRFDEAYDQFYRASWDNALHTAAYVQLAELSSRRENFAQGLEQINHALSTNARNTKGLSFKAALLRRLGRVDQARYVASRALAIDPLDFWAMNEVALCESNQNRAQASLDALWKKMRGDVQAFLELSTDYMNAGMWPEAIDVLERVVNAEGDVGAYPLVHYYLGFLHEQQGQPDEATRSYARASALSVEYCFPFRLEEVDILNAALASNPADARAYYYLGNLLFDHQPDRAIECWEKSRDLDASLAMVHRNLGWAYHRTKNNLAEAIARYEQALACEQIEPRLLLELDKLYELGNAPPSRRLAALESNHDVVVKRQDSYSREIIVLVLSGRYQRAIEYLDGYFFHAQEGNEQIHDVYVDAHLLRGLELMADGEYSRARDHFARAGEYPENLSVGRPQNDPRAAQVAYFLGRAHEAMGEGEAAAEFYQQSAQQGDTANWPEARYYQAQSLRHLNRDEEAQRIFEQLIKTGKDRMDERASADFFAKFGQQATRQTRNATAHYLLGLGLLGVGDDAQARTEFDRAVKLNLSHVWAQYYATK
jgi:tetratricopeptide (TPR) repeat protein